MYITGEKEGVVSYQHYCILGGRLARRYLIGTGDTQSGLFNLYTINTIREVTFSPPNADLPKWSFGGGSSRVDKPTQAVVEAEDIRIRWPKERPLLVPDGLWTARRMPDYAL